MVKKLVLALVLVAMTASPSLAKTIVFATDATWPPMEFVDANHKITGLAVDLMEAAGKEAGFTPEFKAVAWDGIFAGLAAGKYDAICSSVTITDDRKNSMDFSTPYMKVKQALVIPKKSEAKCIEDMKGKTLGAQISTTGHFAVKKSEGVKDKSYDEVGLAFEDLYNGRIDGVVCDDPVAKLYALKKDNYKDALKIACIIPADDEMYGVAVKKGNTETLALINKGLEAVKQKGIEKEILKKWLGTAE
ncbi:basic amino acid ABC transporter substrate-binding protein [Desulfovibrio sp. TomC]|uniref:basic amino acid ABC transporter substrate-binding protein n=1 Tax=Desulfovibrio sp. TomC TaxID=1562888 RepID=UPI00057503CC|nr:basic amino acid ABC transporter substrate-binding protein [Desulfovibrio sp. TomC]KHK01765.1 amino acid ABC transporter, periplasmic amino acid-binding protein [Desulfovibrio sp. TomC]